MRLPHPLALAFVVASILLYVGGPTKHALLTSAAAWLLICIYASWKVGARSLLDAAQSQKLAWLAGGSLALAQICEKAVGEDGIWWTKAFLPLLVYLMLKANVSDDAIAPLEQTTRPVQLDLPQTMQISPVMLAVFTLTGLVAVYPRPSIISSVALGLSHAVLQAFAFLLIERAHVISQRSRLSVDDMVPLSSVHVPRPASRSMPGHIQWAGVLRDVSAMASLATGISALGLESWRFGGVVNYGLVSKVMGDQWAFAFGQDILLVVYALGITIAHIAMFGALILTYNIF